MSGVPCTIVITVLDQINFPLAMALVVIRQIFKFGVNCISLRENKIFVGLSYSPKRETLIKKFGNLPLKYSRLNTTTEEEFKLFEQAMRYYSFGFDETEVVPLPAVVAQSTQGAIMPPLPPLPSSSYDIPPRPHSPKFPPPPPPPPPQQESQIISDEETDEDIQPDEIIINLSKKEAKFFSNTEDF